MNDQNGRDLPPGRIDGEQKALDAFLREQVLETLCTKVPMSMVATSILALAVVLNLWPVQNRELLIGWCLLVWGVAIRRIYTGLKGCRYGEASIETRHRYFRAEALAMAALWAFAAYVLPPFGNVLAEMFMAMVVVGMAAGGMMTLAIDRRIALLYVLTLLGMLVLHFLQTPDLMHLTIVLLLVNFMVIAAISIRQLNEVLRRGIEQRGELGVLRQRLDVIAEQAPVGIFYFDTRYRIIDCNQALSDQIGAPKEELMGLDLESLNDRRPLKHLRRVIEEGVDLHYEGPYVTTTRNRSLWISLLMSPLRDESGRIAGGIAVLQDKTREHEALERAEYLAFHDSLTQLPNRELLEDRFRVQIAQAARNGEFSAILFLDLDRFKHVNDTYGHNVGDELLKEMAARLGGIMRQSDTVCRLGGDEFILFLPMISRDAKSALTHAWSVGRKIHKALARPFEIGELHLPMSASIGVVLIQGNREPLEEILRKADIAMYHAKHRGKGVTSFYEEEMDRQLQRLIRMENDLRHAIDRGEFYLEFQPIVDLTKGRLYGLEALLRWRRADGTVVSPAEFIPVAEESKLIHQIGRWVIEEACQRLRALEREGLMRFYYISLNISSKQFKHQGFFPEVMEIVRRHGVDPRSLKFEITESTLIEESAKAREIITRFNEEGIGFMIDDFGTGYSSLSYLKQYDFETIKIDRSFIRDILVDRDDVALVRAMLDIARQFGYTVVAEGVESADQMAKVRDMDATVFCQGYYFGRPMSVEKLRKYLQEGIW